MADYVLSSVAETDLRKIIRHTALSFGLAKARDYPNQLVQAAKTAARFPEIGRRYTTSNGDVFRKYDVGRHALFYQPTDSGILVVRILHVKMNFDEHLG